MTWVHPALAEIADGLVPTKLPALQTIDALLRKAYPLLISPLPDASVVTTKLILIWNEGRSGAIRYTRSREAKVAARLKDGFTPTQLEQIVRNLKSSPWHTGDNERGWCAPGPEWALHSTERAEQWLEKQTAPAPTDLMAQVRKQFIDGDKKP